MNTYTVNWSNEVSADTPRLAAIEARRRMRDYIQTEFDVSDQETGEYGRVSLEIKEELK